MKISMVDLSAQYKSIKKEIDNAIQEVINNTAFIQGKYLELFEKKFAGVNKVKFCIGASNGTSSLLAALKAIGLKQNEEVITVPNTFIATTEAITLAGGKIKLVDVDEKTFNIDPEKLKKSITKKTKAIIPIHLFGQMANMDEIKKIAKKNKLKIIEDCAQAHLATYKGKLAGTVGDIGSFSFFPGKNLGCYGDGGAVITNNASLSKFMKLYVNHGREKKYVHILEGFNFRLDALQANILNVKLKYLKAWTMARQKNAKLYNQHLKNINEIQTPYVDKNCKHVYHLYVIKAKKRDELLEYLKQNGIMGGIHYPIPLHLQKAYKYLGYKKGDFPIAEKLAKQILSLPMYPELKENEIKFIAKKIKEFYTKIKNINF